MRQLCHGNFWSFQWLKHGKLQTCLGIVVLLFSVAVVIFDAFRLQGQIAFGTTGGVLVVAWIYWALFVRSPGIYSYFGFKLRQGVHGEDDSSDPSRRCHWCFHGSCHRHPHDSYEVFNEVEVCGTGVLTRILYTIFGDGSEEENMFRPRVGFNSAWEALRRCFVSEERHDGIPLQDIN